MLILVFASLLWKRFLFLAPKNQGFEVVPIEVVKKPDDIIMNMLKDNYMTRTWT